MPIFFKDLTDKKFTKLTVIRRIGHKNKAILWECVCECGNSKLATSTNLLRGYTKSCGCLYRYGRGDLIKKHGNCQNYKTTFLYKTWIKIKTRCYSPSSNSYKNYGKKGIRLYKPWKTSFMLFQNYILSRVGPVPENHTLDRINSSKGYLPGNLRWATRFQQNLNRNKTSKKTSSKFKGVSYKRQLNKWLAQIGLEYKNIYLGVHLTEKDAALAYNNAAIKYHGKEAKLNNV